MSQHHMFARSGACKRLFQRPASGALLLAALLTACSPRKEEPPEKPAFPPIHAFDEQRAYDEVAAFDLVYPRHAATPGALRAARHIRDRMQASGLETEIESFEDRSPKGMQSFHNVMARLPGTTRRIILLGSHFDTKDGIPPPFTGANDSGSSTGVLIELARVLAPYAPLPAEIWFVHFDGEECMIEYSKIDGLHGSRHLARQLDEAGRASDVLAMILMDMVGDCDYSITLYANSTPALVQLALAAARDEGIRHQFKLVNSYLIDDHVPFMQRGMPAVNLIDFEFGSSPGRNDHWHSPEDTLDKICPESLGKTGRVVLRMLHALLFPNAPDS